MISLPPEEIDRLKRAIAGMSEALKFDYSRIIANGFPAENIELMQSYARNTVREYRERLTEEHEVPSINTLRARVGLGPIEGGEVKSLISANADWREDPWSPEETKKGEPLDE